jgi:hypothetical protein
MGSLQSEFRKIRLIREKLDEVILKNMKNSAQINLSLSFL